MANNDDHATPYIPMELIEIILSELPVKYLLRFKAVSKAWGDLISNPRFIESHLQQSKNSASQPLFLVKRIKSSYDPDSVGHFPLLRLGDGGFETESVLDLPASRLECSCDGLVLCIAEDSEHVLWNPSCRMHTSVCYPHYGSCGLCRDRVANDIKIVIVYETYYGVYSFSAKSWTTKESHHSGYYSNRCGLCVDGAVYWDVFRRGYFDGVQDIVYFDSGDDELKMMEKPQGLHDTDRIWLVGFKDRLCAWFYDVDRSVVEIWSWDRRSWMKLMTIEGVPKPYDSFRPLYLQENMILIQVEKTRFVVYRPIENVFEEFEDESMEEIDGILPYMESQVLVPDHKTLPHRKRKSFYGRQE